MIDYIKKSEQGLPHIMRILLQEPLNKIIIAYADQHNGSIIIDNFEQWLQINTRYKNVNLTEVLSNLSENGVFTRRNGSFNLTEVYSPHSDFYFELADILDETSRRFNYFRNQKFFKLANIE